jgi:hypothetical protein
MSFRSERNLTVRPDATGMERNATHPVAIGGLLLFLVAMSGAQASQLHLTPLYLTKSDCERRLDRCLQGCRSGALESGMCVSLCYKERESCGAPQSVSPLFLQKQTLGRTSLEGIVRVNWLEPSGEDP